jgi:hypothetical protein
LVLAAALFTLALLAYAPASPAAETPAASQPAAEQATIYKIRNRWLHDQFLTDRGGVVGYGTGDDDSYRWTLEPDAGGLQRLRNVGSGGYAALAPDGSGVVTAKTFPAGAAGQWEIEVGVFPMRWIKSQASGKYLNCEHQHDLVTADGANLPKGDNWWSGQWELVHVGGPPPAKYFRRGQVAVLAPAYGSTIKGDTTVTIRAPGMTGVEVKCWKQGEGFGADSTVAAVTLDASGAGSFIFPANDYPHGPVTVRITGSAGKATDTCFLQLYNAGGVSWNEGMPKTDPPAAAGMKLLFADDFESLSVSKTGAGARYCAHKPGGGDFSSLPFTDPDSPHSPFANVDSYLRIRADANAKTSGLISALRMDGTGITANVPCYFECRLIGPSAPGTWPAFWLMTQGVYKGLNVPADELDTIEAYGGWGPGSPNQLGYWITTHYWNQGEQGKKQTGVYKQVPMTKLGGQASWPWTFHVYGTKITASDTIYYCDNVEVGRHPTGQVSKTQPWFFFINLATGGGWPVDLSRYDGVADMYVDWVRVYQGP